MHDGKNQSECATSICGLLEWKSMATITSHLMKTKRAIVFGYIETDSIENKQLFAINNDSKKQNNTQKNIIILSLIWIHRRNDDH